MSLIMLFCNIEYPEKDEEKRITKNIIFKDFDSKSGGLYPIEFLKNNPKNTFEIIEKINEFINIYTLDYYGLIQKEFKLKDGSKIHIIIGYYKTFWG